jgi:metal-sulfur cluster biosynthetic enzyme
MNNNEKIGLITQQLQAIYDPEFPIIDIYTLGLFYDIKANETGTKILMTFTTPSCPMAESIELMIKNAIWEKFPKENIKIEITFDPMRNLDMIKDQDLRRMFE